MNRLGDLNKANIDKRLSCRHLRGRRSVFVLLRLVSNVQSSRLQEVLADPLFASLDLSRQDLRDAVERATGHVAERWLVGRPGG